MRLPESSACRHLVNLNLLSSFAFRFAHDDHRRETLAMKPVSRKYSRTLIRQRVQLEPPYAWRIGLKGFSSFAFIVSSILMSGGQGRLKLRPRSLQIDAAPVFGLAIDAFAKS